MKFVKILIKLKCGFYNSKAFCSYFVTRSENSLVKSVLGQLDRQIDGQMDGQMDRQIDGQMDRQIDRQMVRWIDRQIISDAYEPRLSVKLSVNCKFIHSFFFLCTLSFHLSFHPFLSSFLSFFPFISSCHPFLSSFPFILSFHHSIHPFLSSLLVILFFHPFIFPFILSFRGFKQRGYKLRYSSEARLFAKKF